MVDSGSDVRRLRLRYAGVCSECSTSLPAGAQAIYERSTRSVRCLEHGPAGDQPRTDAAPPTDEFGDVDVGTPGASARREFERRQAKREQRIRTKYPKLGGLVLALGEEQQSTTAWDTGARGEEGLGKRLNDLSSDDLRVLHDRRIPGSQANIDHLAVTPTGVWVIDAKRYKGSRPTLRMEGGLLRPKVEKLLVGRRECTKLVDGMHKQLDVVREVVPDHVRVEGVLCFVEADWPMIGGDFSTRDVRVLWPKRLYRLLREEGPLDSDAIAAIHRTVAAALPKA